MNRRWKNSNVSTVTEMLDVTDTMIMELSNGEITRPAPCFEDDPVAQSLVDPAIFGEIDQEEGLMGHIRLPIPIVNIQYLFGSKPILPRILGISRKDIEKVVYYGAYVVVDPGLIHHIDAGYKRVVEAEEYIDFQTEHSGAVLLSGAAAIEALLKKEAIPQREHIILHNLPVIPISLRYCKTECKIHKTAWAPFPLEYLYSRLIMRCGRLAKLEKMQAPEIILINERRMLQEYADTLINNGARGIPFITPHGNPAESLQEFFEAISFIQTPVAKPVMPEQVDIDMEALKEQVAILYPPKSEDETIPEEECESVITETGFYDPKNDPEKQAEEKIKELCRPFIDAVIKANFSGYAEEYNDMMRYLAEESILAGIDNADLDEPAGPQFLEGICRTIQMTLKKQSMYL